RQQHCSGRRVTALDGGERLGDRILIGTRVDRLDLDSGILLFEVCCESVDDLGDWTANFDRGVERDLYGRLGENERRKRGGDETSNTASDQVPLHDASSS